MPETKPKAKTIFSISKEINRQSNEVIDYLKRIGIEVSNVMSKIDETAYKKVLGHFKADLEDAEKHKQKLIEFKKKHDSVEFTEIEEDLKKEKLQKQQIEDEKKKKKEDEERARRDRDKVLHQEIEEKKKQLELKKLELEREKKLQEQMAEQKSRIEEEQKKKAATKAEDKPKEKTVKTDIPVPDVKPAAKKTEIKKIEVPPVRHPEKKKEFQKKDEVPRRERPKTFDERQKDRANEKAAQAKDRPQFKDKPGYNKDRQGYNKDRPQLKDKQGINKDKPGFSKDRPQFKDKQGYNKDRQGYNKDRQGYSKDRPQQGQQGQNRTDQKKDGAKPGDRRPPYRDRRTSKPSTFERVTITEDPKRPKKFSFRGKDDSKPAVVKKDEKGESKEDKKRDADKKNKSIKSKYSDGDLKKKSLKKLETETVNLEIEEAIRETLAKVNLSGQASARAVLRKKKKKERMEEEKKIAEEQQLQSGILRVTEFISTSELASLIGVDAATLISKSISLGQMITINQRLDKDIIAILADEYGLKVEFQKELEVDLLEDIEDPVDKLVNRPPVVTVMGHVDHGKTSLLDHIRKANVVAGEAGGITQHIGAYHIQVDNGKTITFLDTPGHEAFTAMRARGAQITDIVVLVVAADDQVMPQTKEAISHALAAGVPIIVAINKIDKPNANIERIKTQLAENNVLIEEWGGKYQSVEISAKQGVNIDKLLEKILLEAEVLDLKANADRHARGAIVEAQLDKGKGIVATVLIQKGTLHVGDTFVAGIYSGKVKAMFDERGKKVENAGPSIPVQVLGFDGLPQAGDVLVCLDSERDTKEISIKRQQLKREQDFRQIKFITLDDISQQIKEGKQVDLNMIIKGDVDGSVEALSDSLLKLTTNEVRVSVIHKGIGEISENDVLLAAASNAIIIGFNVRPNLNARKLSQKENVDIRLHNIIYDVINEVKLALEGLLEPEKVEEVLGTVEVRQTFKVPKIGLVAGCYVIDGKINRNNKVRLIREGIVVYDGTVNALKRFKDDVKEVDTGFECGLSLENYNDIKVGDVIESYTIKEVKRKLE